MGGVFNNENFQSNVEGWKKYVPENLQNYDIPIRLAPITGAIENIGYQDERCFYFDMIIACCSAGIKLSIGDGCPDEKLLSGIDAVKAARKAFPNTQAAVFIKPYPDEKILQRAEWAEDISEIVGVDIDAYNIVTMRNLVQLEKKSPEQMKKLKAAVKKPFAIKGVFTEEDIELVEQVKPDIVVVSNHGGRIETVRGSTADFLNQYGKRLRNCCNQLWVDGGIRSTKDIAAAASLGADQVMVGRPFITALCRGGVKEVAKEGKKLKHFV
ncbi:MAG: alpha-hydroxy-acid oxidizing protein [Clostridia bacterium]|nr:alpha-hydroxy-acid oxidizing protein [Clostridia bacterium]